MKFEMTEGAQKRPQRLLIYGPEGIGKSTLASKMPSPVFVDVEGGTDSLDVKRLQRPMDWGEVLDEVRFARAQHGTATVVVDTADAAERLCQQRVCSLQQKQSIEAFGYGKGYVYAKEEFQRLLDELDACIDAGINAILVGHSTLRKFEQPDETGAYDRWELKLDKRTASLAKEWADAVLFVNYRTIVSTQDNGVRKARGGKRMVYADHRPTWDAKNRWGLPAEFDLDDAGVEAICENLVQEPPVQNESELGDEERARRAACPAYFKRLLELMLADHVTIGQLEDAMLFKGKRNPNNKFEDWEQPFVEWVCDQWDGVLDAIKTMEMRREEEPLPF